MCNWMEAGIPGSCQADTFEIIQASVGSQQSYSFNIKDTQRKTLPEQGF